MPDNSDRRETTEIGVVVSKLHPRDDPSFAQTEFDRLHKGSAHVTAIKGSNTIASPLYGSIFDTLVVYDDLAIGKKGAYDWSPLQLDRVESFGALSQWFALPWKSPTQIILPGFHTPAENGLKTALGQANVGNEMFLSICGLMSTGARTVLLSRWRTGGASSYELIREFVQELPFASAADAWQRSVQRLVETPLDLDREPRVKRSPNMDPPTARHPFFWTGYMLCDTGWSPIKSDKRPVVAALKLNPPAIAPLANPPIPPAVGAPAVKRKAKP